MRRKGFVYIWHWLAGKSSKAGLEKHELAAGILGVINGYLGDRGLSLRQGTIVDATLINAPSSTKNKDGKRDPEMHQTKKGQQYYFGMKAHIGIDAYRGVTHSLETSTARLHDSQVWDELLHGEEGSVWTDKGYVSAEREAEFKGPGKLWGVMRRAPKGTNCIPSMRGLTGSSPRCAPGPSIPSG